MSTSNKKIVGVFVLLGMLYLGGSLFPQQPVGISNVSGNPTVNGLPVAALGPTASAGPFTAPNQSYLVAGKYFGTGALQQLTPGQSIPYPTDPYGRPLMVVSSLPNITLGPALRAWPTVSVPTTSYPKYSATVSFTVAASATDIACLPGQNTNATVLYDARVSGIQTTAGTVHVYLVIRSTADTGSSNAMTAGKDDSTYGVAQSAPVNYTANPVVGTLDHNFDIQAIDFNASTSGNPNDFFANLSISRQPQILRGTNQEACFNLNGVTVAGLVADVTFRWYETDLKMFTP